MEFTFSKVAGFRPLFVEHLFFLKKKILNQEKIYSP